MITNTSKISKGQKINFMVNGGFQSGIVTYFDDKIIKVRWISQYLGRDGEWKEQVMHSTLDR